MRLKHLYTEPAIDYTYTYHYCHFARKQQYIAYVRNNHSSKHLYIEPAIDCAYTFFYSHPSKHLYTESVNANTFTYHYIHSLRNIYLQTMPSTTIVCISLVRVLAIVHRPFEITALRVQTTSVVNAQHELLQRPFT